MDSTEGVLLSGKVCCSETSSGVLLSGVVSPTILAHSVHCAGFMSTHSPTRCASISSA